MNIVFTGGGTGGHVSKNKVIIGLLKEKYPHEKRYYFGLNNGIEKKIVSSEEAQFIGIISGKLRRYWSWKTPLDLLKFSFGVFFSFFKLLFYRVDIVFSAGGYVALPVAIGAWMARIPVITHETDSYPGLANRIIARFANTVVLGYESAQVFFPQHKTIFLGNPISPSLLEKLTIIEKKRVLHSLGFNTKLPVLMVIGGSQGAQQINDLVIKIITELCSNFFVLHITGKGKQIDFTHQNYKQFEYLQKNYNTYLKISDIFVSRGGGNSLAELATTGKPVVVIPLRPPASAGDHQYKNAKEFCSKKHNWILLEGVGTTSEDLKAALLKASSLKKSQEKNHNPFNTSYSAEKIVELIMKTKETRQKH